MDAVWTALSTGVGNIIDMVGMWLEAITTSPILTFFVIVLPLVGIGIGIIGRLFSLRA